MLMRLVRFVALLVLATGFLSLNVDADTVSIGLAEGGAPVTVATGSGQASVTQPFGTFSSVHVTGQGESTLTTLAVSDLLFSDTISTSTSTAGTLQIFVTDQGLTSPLGSLPFESSFTVNELPAGWTVTTSTFVSAVNGLYGGTPLSSHMFSAIGTDVENALGSTGAGPYSVTEEYIIAAAGAGDTNNTIDMSAAPVAASEPAPVAGLGLGLIGLAWMLRRRRAHV